MRMSSTHSILLYPPLTSSTLPHLHKHWIICSLFDLTVSFFSPPFFSFFGSGATDRLQNDIFGSLSYCYAVLLRYYGIEELAHSVVPSPGGLWSAPWGDVLLWETIYNWREFLSVRLREEESLERERERVRDRGGSGGFHTQCWWLDDNFLELSIVRTSRNGSAKNAHWHWVINSTPVALSPQIGIVVFVFIFFFPLTYTTKHLL